MTGSEQNPVDGEFLPAGDPRAATLTSLLATIDQGLPALEAGKAPVDNVGRVLAAFIRVVRGDY